MDLEKYLLLSITKIAQGTSVQKRDRGPSHKHVMAFFLVLVVQSAFISPPHKLCELVGVERNLPD